MDIVPGGIFFPNVTEPVSGWRMAFVANFDIILIIIWTIVGVGLGLGDACFFNDAMF